MRCIAYVYVGPDKIYSIACYITYFYLGKIYSIARYIIYVYVDKIYCIACYANFVYVDKIYGTAPLTTSSGSSLFNEIEVDEFMRHFPPPPVFPPPPPSIAGDTNAMLRQAVFNNMQLSRNRVSIILILLQNITYINALLTQLSIINEEFELLRESCYKKYMALRGCY